MYFQCKIVSGRVRPCPTVHLGNRDDAHEKMESIIHIVLGGVLTLMSTV